MKRHSLIAALALSLLPATAAAADSGLPTMGWSSWNSYRVNISDSLIMSQADAMLALGLKDAGYSYINIDDGYFGGRDSISGKLLTHPRRFPRGLRHVVDHIHGLGLKAGIYSDAGSNTCGHYYDKDSIAEGVGFYGHDSLDAEFFFKECDFDFIKIDFCGGDAKQNKMRLSLDEKERYSAIRRAIDEATDKDVRINICRWDYPGTWVGSVGDSWRISHDISPRWGSLISIIKQNLYLSAYASKGHFNDMDMLEVGRGLTPDEDRTHFGLWCMMCSPLLIGCDLTSIDSETLALLTNPELIALNQDKLCRQAYVAAHDRGIYVLVKDIGSDLGKRRAVAIFNSTAEARDYTLNFADIDLGGKVAARDLFARSDAGVHTGSMTVPLPPHATSIFMLDGGQRLPRTRYEAETAYLSRYQELTNNLEYISPVYAEHPGSSGDVVVKDLGMRPDNDLQWRRVHSADGGRHSCTIAVAGDITAPFKVSVNGTDAITVNTAADLTFDLDLNPGYNTIRLYTDAPAWMPPIDCMHITKATH
ncbi:MAG: alpha-galactosidase [Muribaculaceae bacterium]|nr:alpha-galactosidase [Muribaculaceae bacterium]